MAKGPPFLLEGHIRFSRWLCSTVSRQGFCTTKARQQCCFLFRRATRWFPHVFHPLLPGSREGKTQKIKFEGLIRQIDDKFYIYLDVPSLKLTWPLKIDPWKRRFLLDTTIFRGYVSFRECMS